MRVLVVADIHGNRAALEAIREPFDAVPVPRRPGRLRPRARRRASTGCGENAAHCVRGNHDHGVAQDVAVQGVGRLPLPHRGHPPADRRRAHRPTSAATWPICRRRGCSPSAASGSCSSTPRRATRWTSTPRADPAFWAPRLAGLDVDYVCVGHTHQPYTLQVNGTLVVNPGSVGLQPRRRPAGRLRDHRRRRRCELKRVEYPVERDDRGGGRSRSRTRPPARCSPTSTAAGRYIAQAVQEREHANGNGTTNGTATHGG